MTLVGLHLRHGVSSAVQSLGLMPDSVRPAHVLIARVRAALLTDRRRLRADPDLDLFLPMTLDAKVPSGPLAEKWDRHQFEVEAGQSGQPPPAFRDRRRHRPRRRVGGGVARRARLQRPGLLHPRQPAARAQHRRAGRHQRRQELSERRRQRLPAVLRHDQGRRLSRARGQRLPARPAVASTSSTSASRRACRSRANTAACSTTARSAARRCRARSTRAARPASSCCSARISR